MTDRNDVMVSDRVLENLARVSTGTACGVLIKAGISRSCMKKLYPVFPLGPGKRLVGRAVTARFLPTREDMPDARRSDELFRQRLDRLAPRDFVVVDGMGWEEGAIIGDILSTRMKYRGAVAAVVDGAVRDGTGIREVGLPVFAKALHASPNRPYLMTADVDVLVQCAGILVVPGDVILADDDGVIVIPAALAERVATEGGASEEMEIFVRAKVAEGVATCDIYPRTLLKK